MVSGRRVGDAGVNGTKTTSNIDTEKKWWFGNGILISIYLFKFQGCFCSSFSIPQLIRRFGFFGSSLALPKPCEVFIIRRVILFLRTFGRSIEPELEGVGRFQRMAVWRSICWWYCNLKKSCIWRDCEFSLLVLPWNSPVTNHGQTVHYLWPLRWLCQGAPTCYTSTHYLASLYSAKGLCRQVMTINKHNKSYDISKHLSTIHCKPFFQICCWKPLEIQKNQGQACLKKPRYK